MSVINNALSELAKKKSATSIEAAVVPKVKTRSPFVWVAAGFTLSLAMGGWAISQGPAVENSISTRDVQVAVVDNSEGEPKTVVTPLVSSPTKKLVTLDSANLSADNTTIVKGTQTQSANSDSVVASTQLVTQPQAASKPQSVPKAEVAKPIYVASVAKKDAKPLPNDSKASDDSEDSGIMIEQVELTSEQLSINAQGRAQKALDANDLAGALKGYNEALRYAPRNEDVRQKLAVLYFGKGDTRKAYELYQSGIKLNNNSEKLRLGLSKLLVKANQSEAALSPLIHLPPNPTQDYLAMRAALSQKSQQEEIALESYQKLVDIDSDNARWWLGLAIQQERQLDFTAAKQSYQGALVRVGISSQSQSFVRDRLKIINALGESSDAN
ncbi:tetratricopeptide repeat protein [Vibrio crassostreae]|uniref:tetratricopeptide repeat protein n=1 Tax=Vibrio crassostreae TaxID=246167 RepID=UPI0010430F3F|nr:tetratricopeptide repeat protein [Vibrio crassostreae]TCO02221.1 MSHA biogenesis protein MshN [Vibrio crassostreae]CAK1868719.1 MSHA biogenesis protein MshN [Vibrio crassostreae]CAK1982834.1 MSHA biogenesis protein MshN [Vibrio crassostreae]CAK1993786.1 MSHA biogenesis protein MshN [Vibrio crassostreae]CAK2819096.1 MSHA biogenesis protein MshN [Vibrio crassostreae]